MFIIRPITAENAKLIERFMSDDLLGITSLPRNKHFLHQKLLTSLASFAKDVSTPYDEQYYFVLENLQTGEVGGICGIESKTGVHAPLYSYRLEKLLAPETDLPIPRKQLILHLQQQTNGPTEIGSLYILPSFRKEGLGRLLSLCRFLFMASFPNRFDSKVVAEMRGVCNEQNRCPFWEGLGKHFLNLEFSELMNLLEEIKESIPLVTPHYPVCVSLLKEETQEAIGRVHLDTQPALNLLMQEGFTLTDEIDLFDGGPKIEAETNKIRTFRDSKEAVVRDFISDAIESDKYMISNNRLDFRAAYGELIENEDQSVILSSHLRLALGVNIGEIVRYAPASNKSFYKPGSK